jgi:hypothetical protein
MSDPADFSEALVALLGFLDDVPFTQRVAALEFAFEDAVVGEIAEILATHGVTEQVLAAAFAARHELGRINDIIHATAISLALPRILEPGEALRRPSLAAGNDPTRPFDVETDRRVCEFKLARWDGHDAMRKRQVFKDLVNLAAEDSGRARELYVLGPRPIRFLRTSTAQAGWALDRSPGSRAVFEERFGTLDVAVSAFVAGPGQTVRLIDLIALYPDLFAIAR